MSEFDGPYPGSFTDFSPQRWSARREGAGFAVGLPSGHSIQVMRGRESIPWNAEFGSAQASGRLWVRSLRYLQLIAEAEDGLPFVSDALEQVLGEYRRAGGNVARLGMGSLDHAVALQLRTCCVIFWSLRDGPDDEITAQVRERARLLAAEIASVANSSGFIEGYNHGLMVRIALLHYALVFGPTLDESIRSGLGVEALLTGASTTFDAMVDEDGFVAENTPQYQRMYVDMAEELMRLVEALSVTGEKFQEFDERRDRIVTAYRRLVGAGGLVPPRGDAPLSREVTYGPEHGTVASEIQGIYFRSEPDGWLYVTCGAASPVHKQMDDTAISLRVDGVDLILDAGLLNYDAGDPVSTGIRSQRGHSGVFARALDHHPAHWFYPAGDKSRVDSGMRIELAPEVDTVDARYTVGDFGVRRVAHVTSLGEFRLADRAFGSCSARPVSRFLLPGDGAMRLGDRSLSYRREGLELRMEFGCSVWSPRLSLGWEASGGKALPCHIVEFDLGSEGQPLQLELSVARLL